VRSRPLRGGLLTPLSARLRPRDVDVPSSRLWRAETMALVVVGVVLTALATNDIFWSVQSSAVRVADQNTWRHYTHRNYFNVSAGPLVYGRPVDVSCADATPGPPGERTQICLIMDGPAVAGLRHVIGGWRLPPRKGDFAIDRYGCYGAARTTTICPNG
jgi:hypothetical protein